MIKPPHTDSDIYCHSVLNECRSDFCIFYVQESLKHFAGTSVVQVTATDADDPTYGNSARVVYSILQGQPYFSVEPKTGNLP